jgi:hypothetical protein
MNITGTINGNSIEGYVRSLNRLQQLCNPTQAAVLMLSTEFPHDISPGQEVVLYEAGVKVMTGYVIKVDREESSFDWKVEIHDPYTRCMNYFIEDVITVGHDENDQPLKNYAPQSTDYWIGYLCGLCGASYVSSGGTGTVPQGVQIGMRTVHESLQDVIAYSSQYVRADANGVLHFERVSRGFADITFDECISVEDTTSDEWTRNVVKVFGYSSSPTKRAFATASQGVDGLIPDRITAVGAPMVATSGEAQRVADYLLSELGSMTRIVTAKVEGSPNIRIGKGGRIIYGDTDYTDVITTVNTNTDESGYITEVTIGERCPRIAGWSKIAPVVYAGTVEHGVYVSRDGGHNWADFNAGLPAGKKYVRRIGANYFEEAMAIVNGGLYYTDGTNPWQARTLPAPINSAGDDPAPGHGYYVATDALGGVGEFSVLTTGPLTSGSGTSGSTQSRSWTYTCDTTGSAPSSWKSVQLVTQDVVIGGSSGSGSSGSGGGNYNVFGIDMKSTTGVPYVLGSSGSTWWIGQGWYVHSGDRGAIFDWYWPPSTHHCMELREDFYWYLSGVAPLSATTMSLHFTAVTYSGWYKDNLFMYGKSTGGGNAGGVSRADKDGANYWTWPFQVNFKWDATNVPGFPPYTWSANVGVSISGPWSSGSSGIPGAGTGDVIVFNLFNSPRRNTTYNGTTMGDICDETVHGIAQSPYGDCFTFKTDGTAMYPFLSTLSSGIIGSF